MSDSCCVQLCFPNRSSEQALLTCASGQEPSIHFLQDGRSAAIRLFVRGRFTPRCHRGRFGFSPVVSLETEQPRDLCVAQIMEHPPVTWLDASLHFRVARRVVTLTARRVVKTLEPTGPPFVLAPGPAQGPGSGGPGPVTGHALRDLQLGGACGLDPCLSRHRHPQARRLEVGERGGMGCHGVTRFLFWVL